MRKRLALGAAPPPGEKVPLKMTVCIHDDDDGGACDYALYWKGNPKYPFADESAFGAIVLGNIPERDSADKTLGVAIGCRISQADGAGN